MKDLNQSKKRYFEYYYKKTKLKNGAVKTEIDAKADAFLEKLIKEGSKPCDETNRTYNSNFKIPHFYNQKLFKTGQQFCMKHLTALTFGNVLSITLLLSTPSSAILAMTEKSSTAFTSFNRYVATFLHILKWYKGDLIPGSRMWNSLKAIRAIHNRVSKMSKKKLKARICQYEMSGTLLGFMGLAVTRTEKIGIYNVKRHELEGFIHFWRVIGHMLGIEEKYNICRESLDETIAICDLFISRICNDLIAKPSEDFYVLSTAFYGGLKYVSPFYDVDVHIHLLYMIVNNNDTIEKLKPLNNKQKIELSWMTYFLSLYQLNCFRIFVNFIGWIFLKIVQYFW